MSIHYKTVAPMPKKGYIAVLVDPLLEQWEYISIKELLGDNTKDGNKYDRTKRNREDSWLPEGGIK